MRWYHWIISVVGGVAIGMLVTAVVHQLRLPASECWHGQRIGSDEPCDRVFINDRVIR